MANNCYNSIHITGNRKQIEDFQKYFLGDSNTENNGFESYRKLIEEFTKEQNDARWFDMDIQILNSEEILITGDSAWCPSLEMFTKISKKYQSFKIYYTYEEMGCDFAGFANINKGICEDNSFTYWKGIIATEGEKDALDSVIENELECYENLEELEESTMFLAFSKENQKIILETYKKNQL